MSNIEKICQEIERRMEACKTKNGFPAGTICAIRIETYEGLLSFINSLPEEIPPCQTGFKGHTDPVGRRGRQGMVPRWISEKAEEYQRQMEPPYDSDDIISAYESGAMWQKSQMLKEAVEGEIGYWNQRGLSIRLDQSLEKLGYGEDTEVKIIIVKEDQE